MQPILFLDDDPKKWNSRIHDIPVAGAPELLVEKAKAWKLDKVIIAAPSASVKRIQKLVAMLGQAHLDFATVPSIGQLAAGQVQVSQIRPVDIEDLLRREPVQLEMENIRGLLRDQVVMVTGAGGSIGSELCRQIAAYRPRRLLLVEQAEGHVFQIEQELLRTGYGGMIEPLIGNILDERRMREILEQFGPHVVFHAAAHKHVPLMESHPAEAIKNNTLGTVLLARLAVEYGVRRFVLISTDKAINPTSVMGATKRLAEIWLQSLAAHNGHKTRFMAVRFGNVLDSSGSVVRTFKQQIAMGGPVTVTHPNITRYFMTIPEAVSLVLQSATQGEGGEIFVLDMGQPVKILDLARQLIELSGLKPEEDIEIKFVGLRPGEKLFEEISHDGENIQPTNHAKILRFVCPAAPLARVEDGLAQLEQALHEEHPDQLKKLLQELIPEYKPCIAPVTTPE
jgi:FlaA1/EpsC-like NDP-sugar epimerase